MQSIYDRDSKITDYCSPRQNIVKDPHIGIATLAEIPDGKATFYRYRLGWMGEPFGSYSLEEVYEFYASYTALFYFITLVGKRAHEQPPLDHTLVRGTRVDLSKETIKIFLFGPFYERRTTITEFDYRMTTVRSKKIIRDLEQREKWRELIRWMAQKITKLRSDAPWVEGKVDIKKSTLHFALKFWWSIVRPNLCSTTMDNALSLDLAVLVAKIIVGYDIDFAWRIHDEIHERSF
ncbi:hypothetical protein FXO37_17083 [Capsicum annuum]|nr:hypothetical protein FXO37_17083 [Capsicum annuum]